VLLERVNTIQMICALP